MFKDSKAKTSTALLDYKDFSTFQDFFLENNNIESPNHKNFALSTCQIDTLIITSRLKKKVKPITKVKKAEVTTYYLKQKAKNIKKVE